MKITEYYPFKSREAKEKYLKFYDAGQKNGQFLQRQR